MLGRVGSTHGRTIIVNQVCSSLSSLLLLHHQLHTASASAADAPSPSNSSRKLSHTHFDSSLAALSHVAKSVISKCSARLNHKVDSFTASSASLDQLLLTISHVFPETCRKFLRVSRLNPEEVLEILSGFELGAKNLGYDAGIVGSLWEIFKRAGDGNEGFKHLPKSCELMASMLIGAKMFREVELLLSTIECQGISMASDEIFCALIERYVYVGELDRAVLMYDQLRGKGLVPSLSCYRSLIDLVTKERKDNYVLCIYEDLVEMGLGFGDVIAMKLETFVINLCQDGRIKEARKLLKKIVTTGWQPNKAVLREVSDVYCEKKDFEDLVGFFAEMKCVPDILVGNKIIFSLCSHFGTERAHTFLWEMENLGFRPNERTFGVLIGWSCHEGKLKDAFVYLSEILSRGLKPDRRSYNSLISCLCKVGMEEHAGAVFNEMNDNGITPNLETFRALLAGYSRARRFGEVKVVMNEMVNCGYAFMSQLEDPIANAFSILGFDASTVKVKRDNDAKRFRTEFVDELGNGLYLDTNLDEFEKTLAGVLEESLIPDFNLLVMRQCNLKKAEAALSLVDEMVQWGQKFSVRVLSALVNLLCESSWNLKEIPGLLDKMPQLFGQLEHETLNSLIHTLGRKGFMDTCKLLVHEMERRNIPIAHSTYTALLVGSCKIGRMDDILHYWDLFCKSNGISEWKDFVTILDLLCQRRMLEKLLELLKIMLTSKPDIGVQVCDVFVERLSYSGMTDVGHTLVDELQRQHFELSNTSYSHLIKGYYQEKRFSEVLMVFDAIRYGKFALSYDILSPFGTKPCQFNGVENSVAFRNMFFKEKSSSTLSLYTALINSFCRTGNIAEANTLFMELISENVVPNDEIYNALLQGHCQIIDLKTVKELLCIMLRRSLTFSVSSYRDLVSLMCKKGMFRSALGLKTLILKENNFSSSITYNILIFNLFRTENLLLVEAVLDEMEQKGLQLDQVGYDFLIRGFSICKDMPRSVKYLNTMISKGFKPSNRSVRAVMQYFCRNGQIQNALQLSKEMALRSWTHSLTLQYALVEGLVSHGKIHLAERFLSKIEDKGLIPSTVDYEMLIQKFCQYDRLKRAVSLLDQMIKRRNTPDSSTYDCIIQGFCACNKIDRAMDFFNEMVARNLKPSIATWDSLIEKFCLIGRTFEAEMHLGSMVQMGETPTKKMYSSVIDRYRLENNVAKASELMKKMQQHGYEPDFAVQWSLISRLKSLSDQKAGIGNGNQGFLSKLLHESGFPSKGVSKLKSR